MRVLNCSPPDYRDYDLWRLGARAYWGDFWFANRFALNRLRKLQASHFAFKAGKVLLKRFAARGLLMLQGQGCADALCLSAWRIDLEVDSHKQHRPGIELLLGKADF